MKLVILTLGEKGSLLLSESECTHFPSEKVKAVDTTGAGDAFVGTLAFCMAEGMNINEAVKKANRVAAISVQKPGTQSSFPDADNLPFDIFS